MNKYLTRRTHEKICTESFEFQVAFPAGTDKETEIIRGKMNHTVNKKQWNPCVTTTLETKPKWSSKRDDPW